MSAVQRFHEAANDALVKLSGYCPPGAKLALVIITPGEPERDIILEDQGLDRNEVVSALRRRGLSIDGDNVYKRDLCDLIVGAMSLGKQNTSPPPAGHWGERFWEIGRAEGELQEELVQALVPLLAHWADLAPGESLNVDRARVAIAKATGTTPPNPEQQ
ncbi:hypothetical protein [Pseudomonas gingeri]|uniref:hypothetical protein n=1 Tax=Pseudomonas gingeri TaxID=117681 RepID=UPI00210894D9|nr:hypothetical protein [Pseudomonas gingeri]